MQIDIPEEVAVRLERLAQERGASVSDLLEMLLDRYVPETSPGSLAELAQNALEANLASTVTVTTADNSREILNTEYASYLPLI